MRSAASSAPGSFKATDPGTQHDAASAAMAARRAQRQRKVLRMGGISFVLDAAVLMVYVHAGTTTVTIATGFGLTGLAFVAVFMFLSDDSLTERFHDQLVLAQTLTSLAIMLIFLAIAPEVGCVFLCGIFMVFAFAALRSTFRNAVIGWSIAVAGLAGLFLFTDKPISMPMGTLTERLATMLVFTTVLGKGMLVGLFSSSLQDAFYKRGLELREAYKQIEELAEIDELTGAYNRRMIMQTLNDEVVRAQRSNMPCTVVLIDLDWFKQINDRFGHPVGDEVLRTFAITMFANIRSIDKLGRYGGEEFLLILPETTDNAAHRIVDRLRAIVADLDWTAISHGMTVTMSAGLSMLRQDDTADSVLARADRVLYQAKDLGRNKVVSA